MHSTNTYFREWFQYCPHCKTELVVEPYIVKCSACAFVDYLNPAPCVTLLITKGDKILFAKRAIEPHKGSWDLPGGFISHSESPLEAAQRELAEETGITTSLLQQYGEPIPDLYENRPTLCTFYTGQYLSGELDAKDDVEELAWFSPNEIPPLPFKSIEIVLDRWRNDHGKVY